MIYHISYDILYVIHFENISRLLKIYIITQQVTQDIESILKPKGFALTKRGTIAVKGKGDMVIIIIVFIIIIIIIIFIIIIFIIIIIIIIVIIPMNESKSILSYLTIDDENLLETSLPFFPADSISLTTKGRLQLN